MPEFRSVVSFKICKLFQESWNLSDDSEQVIGVWMVMHFESFNRLVVLNYWVEWFLLKFLPVSTQVILGVRIKQEQKVFNVWNYFFKLEVVSGRVKLESFLFEFSDAVWGLFESLGYFLVDFLLVKLVFFGNRSFEAVIFYHPKVLEVHQKGSENCDELFKFFRLDFSYGCDFMASKSLLRANQQSDQLLEFLFVAKKYFAPKFKYIIKKVLHILQLGKLF